MLESAAAAVALSAACQTLGRVVPPLTRSAAAPTPPHPNLIRTPGRRDQRLKAEAEKELADTGVQIGSANSDGRL